jgi:hypothetical protein
MGAGAIKQLALVFGGLITVTSGVTGANRIMEWN